MATCPKCQTWYDENESGCVSCGRSMSKGRNVALEIIRNEVMLMPIWSQLPKWAMALACKLSLHHGEWIYDSNGPCTQILFCLGCGEQNFRIQHDVKDWESDEYGDYNTGVCERCKQRQHHKKFKGG